jgi:hypothetical protein
MILFRAGRASIRAYGWSASSMTSQRTAIGFPNRVRNDPAGGETARTGANGGADEWELPARGKGGWGIAHEAGGGPNDSDVGGFSS